MRNITLILALLLGIGLMFATVDSVATGAKPAAEKAEAAAEETKSLTELPAEELGGAFTRFGKLMDWFIGIIVVISLFSIIRIILVKRRSKKQGFKRPSTMPPPGQQQQQQQDNQMPPHLPVSPRRPFAPFTYLLLIIALVYFFFTFWGGGRAKIKNTSYSEFTANVKIGSVKRAEFTERDIFYTDIQGAKYHTVMPFANPALVDSLVERGVTVVTNKPSNWGRVLELMLPLILLVAFWMFFLRGMNNQNTKAFSFGKSKARLHVPSKTNISFKDVAGVDEAKEELQEIVEFLKDPKKFQRLGGRIPRGVLLVGRPGTGKTLLAKAVSGEAGVPFFSISGSDFVEMFVGVGAARVRDLFDQGKKHSPCIIFIDEIDAVGRHRGTGLGGGHDER